MGQNSEMESPPTTQQRDEARLRDGWCRWRAGDSQKLPGRPSWWDSSNGKRIVKVGSELLKMTPGPFSECVGRRWCCSVS